MTTKEKPERMTLTVREAAQMMGVSYGLMWRLIEDGHIKTLRLGARILIPRSTLDAMVREVEEQQKALVTLRPDEHAFSGSPRSSREPMRKVSRR